MRTLEEYVNARMEKAGFRGGITGFCSELGIGASTFYRAVRTPEKSRSSTLEMIATVLRFREWSDLIKGWKADDVLWGIMPLNQPPRPTTPPTVPIQTQIPIRGEVAASGFVEFIDVGGEVEYLPLELPGPGGRYALRVRGDSISPKYEPGDMIIVRPMYWEEPVQPGDDIVIACDGPDSQATFKRVKSHKGQKLVLMPLNPKYKTITCDTANIARAGKVVGLYRDMSR